MQERQSSQELTANCQREKQKFTFVVRKKSFGRVNCKVLLKY